MSRKPEFVVTGLHIPGVHFWARVLVSPDRLSQVRENILRYGLVHLKRGERLEIETVCGEDKGLAIAAGTVKHFDSRGESYERGRCLVSWNEVVGDINVYGDDQDDLAAMHGPLIDALVYRDRVAVGQCWIDADRIRSIHVGDVHVFFDRPDDAKDPKPEDILEQQEAERSFFRSKGLVWPTGASNEKVDTTDETTLQAGAEITLPPGTQITALDPHKLALAQIAMLKAFRAMERAGLTVGTAA